MIGSRSPNDSKYKPVDNNSFSIKLKENKNSNNTENHCVIKSTSKKEIMIVGDSMIKHVNGREVFRDDSVKIRFHPGATTDDIMGVRSLVMIQSKSDSIRVPPQMIL